MCVLVIQLCLILWDPMDCSPPGSSIHGIFQASMLEWVAIFFYRGPSKPRGQTWLLHCSHVWLFATPWIYSPWNSLCQNTGVGSLSLLQRIFPTQRLNPGLLHCRWILHQLSHNGSPRILEWVAYPFSTRSSQPRDQTKVSCIVGGFFISWATRKTLFIELNEG